MQGKANAERCAHGLALSESRPAWLPAAHELSRKMSAPEHRALMPATVFAHAPDQSDVADPPSTFGAANTNGSHA